MASKRLKRDLRLCVVLVLCAIFCYQLVLSYFELNQLKKEHQRLLEINQDQAANNQAVASEIELLKSGDELTWEETARLRGYFKPGDVVVYLSDEETTNRIR